MQRAACCLAALTAFVLTACPNPAPEPGRPPLTNPPVMDLVVGDMGLKTAKSSATWRLEQPKLVVYFDALRAAQAAPDGQPEASLVLGTPQYPPLKQEGFALENPVDVALHNGDLYVVDQGAKRIYIWRDYRNHNAYAEPDVTLLDNPGQAYSPWELLISHGHLFVSDMYHGLLAWPNADALESHAAPDIAVMADPMDTGPDAMLSGLEIDEAGALYISWLTGGIHVYYDFIAEYASGGPVEVDARLGDISLQHMAAPVWKLLVHDNVLYAHTHSSSSTLYVFSPADALITEQRPDAVLTPPSNRLHHPFSMAAADDTLFVGNMFSDTIGVCGWRPAGALSSGQSPSFILDYYASGMGPCSNLHVRGGILFATSSARPVCGKQGLMQDMNIGDVHIFGHAAQLESGGLADLVIRGGVDFLVPLSIDAAAVSAD